LERGKLDVGRITMVKSKIFLPCLFIMIFSVFSNTISPASATDRTFYDVWNISGKCGIHSGNDFPARIKGWAGRYSGPPQPSDYHKAAVYLAEQKIGAINVVAHVSKGASWYQEIRKFLAALEEYRVLTGDIKVILDLEPDEKWDKTKVENEVKAIIDDAATRPTGGFYPNVVGISLDMEWMQGVPGNQKTATLNSSRDIVIEKKKLELFFPIWYKNPDRDHLQNMPIKSSVIPLYDGLVDRNTQTKADGSNEFIDNQVKYMKRQGGFSHIGVLPIARENLGALKKKHSIALKTWNIYKHAINSAEGVDYVVLGSGLAIEDPFDIYTTKPILDTGGKKSVEVQYYKDTITSGDEIFVFGSTGSIGTTLPIFVVYDTSWDNGKEIPDRVPGTEQTVVTDDSGKIYPPQIVWDNADKGKYDIIVDVNGNGKYDEDMDALDDNDVKAAGFVVRANATLPDLIVWDITWTPEVICPCDWICFTAEIKNIGNSDVTDSFWVDFWVDDVWIDGEQVITPPNIPPDGSVFVSIDVWQADEPCWHTVSAYADQDDEVVELEEYNNDWWEDFEVQGPDLIVEWIDWWPEDVCPCENITFTTKVTNIGKCPLNDTFDVDLFIDDELICTVREGPPLPPGSSVIVQCEWHADEPCWHTIEVWADLLDEVKEHPDTEPNWLSEEFEVQGPDLIVSALGWMVYDWICPCDNITFWALIRNVGLCNLTDPFVVGFFMDGESVCNVTVTQGLQAGASVTVNCTWHADKPCNHTIRVVADPYDEVKEHPDQPNYMEETFEVQGSDLIVEDIDWIPKTIYPCNTVTFTAKVTNIGLCDVNDSFVVRFWVDGVWIGDVTVAVPPNIPPGGFVLVSIDWHADVPCNHTIRAYADWWDDVREHPDQPNDRNETFKVIGPPCIGGSSFPINKVASPGPWMTPTLALSAAFVAASITTLYKKKHKAKKKHNKI
jgi:hypothetical protein